MNITELKYKKTGIDWMPEVPEHWDVVRLKSIVNSGTNGFWGSDPKNDENDIICVRVADIDEWVERISDTDLTLRNIEPTEQEGRLLNYGDLIIEKSGGGDISPVGRVVVFNLKKMAVTSNFMARLNIVTNINHEFLFYYFKFLYRGRLNIPSIKATTGIQNLDLYSYLQNPVPVPPKEEQNQIVQYIKAKCEKINRFIEKKLRLIELLKEQRKGIINDKLQINAKKMRLKWCVTKVGSGVTPRGGAEVYQDEGIVFLRSQNVHNDGLKLDNVSYISEEINSGMKGSEVQFNDVLINVTGASIGRCHVFDIDVPANVNQHVCIIRPIQEVINSEFLMLQLQSVKIQTIIDMVEGASREGLTNKDIKNFFLFIPTIEEQKQIVAHIKAETATIDTAIAKAEREIELIKEYKEAMIGEAVMGKIL